jgi:thioredoxin 1
MSDTKDGAVHLNKADFATTLAGSKKPVMVDFFANWCGPCQMAAPIIDKLAKEYADSMLIAKVDTDENADIAQKYGVMSIPTVLVFTPNAKGEMEVSDRQVGFPGEDGYRQMIAKVVKA